MAWNWMEKVIDIIILTVFPLFIVVSAVLF